MDVEKLGEKADNSTAELSTSWRLASRDHASEESASRGGQASRKGGDPVKQRVPVCVTRRNEGPRRIDSEMPRWRGILRPLPHERQRQGMPGRDWPGRGRPYPTTGPNSGGNATCRGGPAGITSKHLPLDFHDNRSLPPPGPPRTADWTLQHLRCPAFRQALTNSSSEEKRRLLFIGPV